MITFDNKPFSDFNTFEDESQLYGTPSKDSTFYSIPGKSGDLEIFNNRYLNKELSVNCFIRENFGENYSNLINFLYSSDGYKRFETSVDPDVYRMASFVSEIEPDTGSFLKYGQFTLTFNFKPQKWLKMGEIGIDLSSSQTIFNPTNFTALPLFEVVGTGTLNINSSTLVLANNTSTTMIDCEMQDCYEGVINRNPDLTITGGFPSLKKGENVISFTGFTSVKLIPRWWKL